MELPVTLRMALGGTEKAVELQFLCEATVMSLMGGAIGVACGVIGSVLIAYILEWPTLIPVLAILVAVVFSAVVGILFGYYPAKKAAALDPIEALRYE